MDHKTVEDYILSMPDSKREYPFGEKVAVYKIEDKMFALIEEDKSPLRVSLRCDPKLAKLLRERYTEVMPGQNLNKKDWNTIVVAGELPSDEMQSFIRHSYEIVKNS